MDTDTEFLGWKESVNSNPIVKENGFKLVKELKHNIFIVLGVLFLLVLVSFVGTVFYLGMEGKLSSTYENIINPMFNASVKVENTFDFKPSTVNDYEFKPNYTIINNIILPECESE